MIYFDNAATGGKKPDSVIRAVTATLQGYCANPGRSGHTLSLAAAQDVLRARKLLQNYFKAPDCERVILTKTAARHSTTRYSGFFVIKTPQRPPKTAHCFDCRRTQFCLKAALLSGTGRDRRNHARTAQARKNSPGRHSRSRP